LAQAILFSSLAHSVPFYSLNAAMTVSKLNQGASKDSCLAKYGPNGAPEDFSAKRSAPSTPSKTSVVTLPPIRAAAHCSERLNPVQKQAALLPVAPSPGKHSINRKSILSASITKSRLKIRTASKRQEEDVTADDASHRAPVPHEQAASVAVVVASTSKLAHMMMSLPHKAAPWYHQRRRLQSLRTPLAVGGHHVHAAKSGTTCSGRMCFRSDIDDAFPDIDILELAEFVELKPTRNPADLRKELFKLA